MRLLGPEVAEYDLGMPHWQSTCKRDGGNRQGWVLLHKPDLTYVRKKVMFDACVAMHLCFGALLPATMLVGEQAGASTSPQD